MKLTRKRLRRIIRETMLVEDESFGFFKKKLKPELPKVYQEIMDIDNFNQGAGSRKGKIYEPESVIEYKLLMIGMRRVLSYDENRRVTGFTKDDFKLAFEPMANKKIKGELSRDLINAMVIDALEKEKMFDQIGIRLQGKWTNEPDSFMFYISDLFKNIKFFLQDMKKSGVKTRDDANKVAEHYAKKAMEIVNRKTGYGYGHVNKELPALFWNTFINPDRE